MKKKIVTLLVVSAMAAAMVTGCGNSGSSDSRTKTTESKSEDGEYQYVSAADTVKAAKAGNTHVLDVRTWEDYVSGRIADSEWCPIFPLEDESLEDGMADYAEKLKDGKDIYIVCNSGQKGAQKTTEVLEGAGIDAAKIYTVEGGAKELANVKGALTSNRADENIEWQYISGKEAVEAVGNDNIQILDVRDDDTYADGHLEDSLQTNLKEIEDADAQTAMYDLAVSELDASKPIYLLCYSGNKCAKTAISVMRDAGFETDNLFIIENGAKDGEVSGAFVK